MLRQARDMWGSNKMSKQEIATVLGVVYGDICRQVRDNPISDTELKKELGNVIFSVNRWIDDLGFEVEECIELAKNAQSKYMSKGE